ncbi:endolytic transglycosylase MltG [Candidatus Gracilibacteria bacterium]|nr:endolytic transglycosylase MltG [Candidatus Gracilibacteria bacterium]
MLANFNTKVWQKIDATPGSDFHNQIILASVVDRESGRTRGITAQTAPLVNEERSIIASVLFNRLEQGIRWQTNPTVDYGTGFQICEQTVEIDGCKFLDDPVFDTLYNTYQVTGYPIGPVTSPSVDNIQAALNPAQTDYLFFVADDTGKNYFAKTDSDHLQNIKTVKTVNASL